MKTVGSYEAKTHLAQLLEAVTQGETVTITKHGVPVALIVPASSARRMSAGEAVEAMRALRDGVKPLGGLSVRDLIDEGRR